jgi:hypothetical protein
MRIIFTETPAMATDTAECTTEDESDTNNGDIEMPHAATFTVPNKVSSDLSTILQKNVSRSSSVDMFEGVEVDDVIPVPKKASASTSSTSKSNQKTGQKQGVKRSRARSTDISRDISVDMFEDAEETPTPKAPFQFNFLAAAEKEAIPVQPTKKFILDSTFVVDKSKSISKRPAEKAIIKKEAVDDLDQVFESSVMIVEESDEEEEEPRASPRPPTPPKKKNSKKYAQDETYIRSMGLDSKSILECVEEEGDSEDLSPVIMQKPHAAVSTVEEAGAIGWDKNSGSSASSSSSSSSSSFKSALTHQPSAPSFSGYNKAATTKTLDSIKKKTEDAERNKKENLKRKQELQKK